jgi:nucleotide-binding universal stress UspA family protein
MKRICAWCGEELDANASDRVSDSGAVTHGVCPTCRRIHFVSPPNRPDFSVRRILVPFDWSAPACEALRMAASLARQHGAELSLLHVVPTAVATFAPPPENYLLHLHDDLRSAAAAAMQGPVQCQVVEGDPTAAILATARDHRIDLIVMGTHGRCGMSRLLMGSVAEGVLRQATCPVLTLRAAEPDSGTESLSSHRAEVPMP